MLEGNGNAARVVAASRKARKSGIEPGMTLPQARALVPKLIARGRDRACERAAQQALLEVAETFSPRVEDAGEGVVYLDLDGHPRLLPLSAGDGRPLFSLSKGGAHAALSPLTLPSPPARGRGNSEAPSRVARDALSLPPLPAGEGRGEGHLLPLPAGEGRGEWRLLPLPAGEGRGEGHSRLASLARDILHAAEKGSLPARVGVAASKLAARIAASLPDTPTVVSEGSESEFLAPLPLEKLAPEMEIAAALERWGLRTVGDLAKLPEGEVASRLGESGRALHATARGIDPRPLEPYLPPPAFSEGMDLEWPLASLEPFLFVGHAALERLVRRLEAQALACARLEVALKLDPDGHDVRAISLPAPTRDVKTLLTLVRLELEARPPGAAVAGFSFAAHPDQPRRAQLSLFGPAALSPDRLATTIARLAALLGAERVGSPSTVDGHVPERFALTGYAPPPPPNARVPPPQGRGLLGVRVLRPPVPLEVIVDSPDLPAGGVGSLPPLPTGEIGSPPPLPAGEGRGEGRAIPPRPISLKSPPDSTPPISGAVRVAAGPWSLEEGWWSESPADRDYWDVELANGGLYRIYRDRGAGSWFADGVYD